jgi:hypothetical protein
MGIDMAEICPTISCIYLGQEVTGKTKPGWRRCRASFSGNKAEREKKYYLSK